jgi:GNAT superfamily N-acetyltransferase
VSEAPSVTVERVELSRSRMLRTLVLRPGEPLDRPMYARESDPETIHVAALDAAGEALAVGSVMADPHPYEPRSCDWRLRGMATREDRRGLGLGAQVLASCERLAVEQGAQRLWCNARIAARGFYERAGMQVEGEQFEIAGIGPHLLMSKPLA